MFVRRESGIDGPTAMTSASAPRWSARRPARRSRARDDGASTVTSWPSRRSAAAAPVDVRVHLVRLRPRERRDEADAEAHRSRKLQLVTWLAWPRSRSRRGRTGRTRSRGRCASIDADGQRVRAAGGRRDRALPLRALADEAVLRQVAPARRLRRRRLGASRVVGLGAAPAQERAARLGASAHVDALARARRDELDAVERRRGRAASPVRGSGSREALRAPEAGTSRARRGSSTSRDASRARCRAGSAQIAAIVPPTERDEERGPAMTRRTQPATRDGAGAAWRSRAAPTTTSSVVRPTLVESSSPSKPRPDRSTRGRRSSTGATATAAQPTSGVRRARRARARRCAVAPATSRARERERGSGRRSR